MEEGLFGKYNEVVRAKGEDLRIYFKVLDKIKMLEPTFGKPDSNVEIDAAELERIRQERLEK